MPMHDPDTNRLTSPSFDPHSRQPSYKYAAVDVRPGEAWDDLPARLAPPDADGATA